uniref:ITPR interacting domain containing 2 n=1 Tax=Salarias fasciatus TaxID=181472 RepID=A0A672F8N8_SALFA
MEGAALESNTAPDVRVKPVSVACLRRQAWAHSRDSIWQESKPEPCGPPGPQRSRSTGDAQRPSVDPGQNPNKIASWLIECRTPLGASLDDQSPPPHKGVPRNGCSFEDDLSLGAEANHLLSNNSKTESCYGLVADQKRSQYKERGRSMNSTGSGKSSTVSSVSELLDLYEEDPEEILFNLGFGREEPDLNAKIPSRFFNSSSVARGIDIKVYLKAQLQRMELENPNYALTSRFRQIEVLTTVANEFFQLYSQVSGQPVQRISSKDQDSEGGDEGRSEERPPPLKKSNSALNVAKLLKKTITKHNLLAASPESPAQPNGRTAAVPGPPQDSGPAPARPEQDGDAADAAEHRAEAGGQKVVRKKDNCSLATVTEESGGDGEPDLPSDSSPEQSGGGGGGPEGQVDSADLQAGSQSSEEGGAQRVSEEKDRSSSSSSSLEKAPVTLTPPHLAQLRTENTDSFDMEEIQSNEDETLPPRASRAAEMSRTVSQQSDSSGFAEEPSTDSGNSLKVQDSSDSCDSETTVTSHPSQDLTTPVALDQPTFDLPDTRREEAGPAAAAAEVDGRSRSVEGDESLDQFPQYTVHHLPKLTPTEEQREDSVDEDGEPEPEPEPEIIQCVSAAEQETPQESEESDDPQSQSASEPDPPHTDQASDRVRDTSPPAGDPGENQDQPESLLSDDHNGFAPPTPSAQVLSALNRAKLSRMGRRIDPESDETPASPGRGRGSQRGAIRLQRSSSLPSSLLAPSRVVSSVKIQVGRGQASCSQPRFSVRYTQEDDQLEEEVKREERTSVLSTLVINPAPNKKPAAAAAPKPIPSHLMRSCCSLQSYSPPPELTPGGQSWSTQSVPDLSSDHRPLRHFPPPSPSNTSVSHAQKSWNPGFASLPGHNPPAQYFDSGPSPSPRFNFNPYGLPQHTHPLHHSQPYSSLPNLFPHQNPPSGPAGLHSPAPPPVPQHQSMTNLHQPSSSSLPYHVGPAHLHPGAPMMHHQGFSQPYTNPSPYTAAPYGTQSAPQFLSYHGYNVSSFPHPVSQYPPPAAAAAAPPHLPPEHSLYPGLAPLAPGFHPGLGSAFSQGYNPHAGFAPPAGPGPSGTELQLRRVLQDIRGTVQSLSENRANTPDTFSERRASQPGLQSLAEFQQKRRSLSLFRRQMMDLELSIMQQQALVYNHLSPADRMEVEKLQSLRSSVREELQELEQQLEEKLMDLIHSTHHRGLRSNNSVENLFTASALRAMEPMSELLSEQFYLQSELNYDGHDFPTSPSSRSSSPLRGRGRRGADGEQKPELYRTSVDITPATPPRPNARSKGRLRERDSVGGREEEAGRRDSPEKREEGATGGLQLDNLQQLIKEIRESVAQEVRKEIYSELLAAVTPQPSPVPAQQHRP